MIPKQKQTALEWLFEQIWDTPKDKLTWYSLLNQALKKEKEQIINAFEYGQINVNENGCITEENGAEEYYNQTYN